MPRDRAKPHEAWYQHLINHHLAEADALVAAQLAMTRTDENGCWVTPTVGPRKVRFRGMQDRLYRVVYCIRHRYPAGREEVVRHRCNNRRCVNPRHLTLGSQRDNNLDDRAFRANGVDFGVL